MDPGRQIYLGNNKKDFGQKLLYDNKIKKKFRKKNFLKKFGKTKFGNKNL